MILSLEEVVKLGEDLEKMMYDSAAVDASPRTINVQLDGPDHKTFLVTVRLVRNVTEKW